MNKTLYIHIGTGKTGTTAIQDFLSANSAQLEQTCGLRYIQSVLQSGRHHTACLNSYPEPRHEGSDSFEKTRTALRKVDEEIKSSHCENFILSSENFPGVSSSELNSLYIHEIGRSYRIKIIVYLRRQDEYLESWHSQLVKTTNINSNIYTLRSQLKNKGLFDYKKLVERWTAVYGQENIIVRPYEKDQLAGGDAVHDFISLWGLDGLDGFETEKKVSNKSLSRDQVVLIQAFYRAGLERFVDAVIQKPFDFDTSTSKYFLSPQERDALIDEYEESNAYVARKYLGREDGKLFYAKRPSEAEPDWRPADLPATEYLLRAMTHIISKQLMHQSRRIDSLEEQLKDSPHL